MNDNDKTKNETVYSGQKPPQSGSFTPGMVQPDAPPPPPPPTGTASVTTAAPLPSVQPQSVAQTTTQNAQPLIKTPEQQAPNLVEPSPVAPPTDPADLKSTLTDPSAKDQSLSVSTQTPPPPGSDVIATSPKKGFPKILIILIGLLLILGLAFGVYKFVLPMLQQDEVTTVTWWGLWEDASIIEPLIKEYETKTPGVKIKYVKQSKEDYRERLLNSLAKGEGPDMFRFHNTWVPMFKNELDNVPAFFMSAADYAQTYYPVTQSDMSSGAGLVGVPLGYDALTLFINEEMFEEAGLTPPSTWDDLRESAKILTKRENDAITQAGVALGRTENVDHWPEIIALMMLQNGVNLSDPAGTNPANTTDALIYYTLFSEKDGVWDETLPSSTVAFANGKLAMYFGPSWRAFNIQELNPNLKFKTVPLPQVPKDNPDEPSYTYATYWVEGVWERSPNKEAAWDFLKFMSSKESLEKFFLSASNTRGFGEAYPRVEMADLLKGHPVLSSIVVLAPDARSWYLADRTFDGPTGINTQINKYFEDAINAIIEGEDPEDVLIPLGEGVKQVLSNYGLVRRSNPSAQQ
jgi:multiple sugar transport system substrate-binding protein